MLNYSNTISEEKSYSGLQMKEVKPIMKLIIRGKKREFCSIKCKSRFHYLNIIKPKRESRKNDTARLIL